MNQQLRTSPPMRWRLTSWLTAPYLPLSPEGEAELRALLFSRTIALLLSAALTTLVEVLAVIRHPTPALVTWLALDAGLLLWVRVGLVATILRFRARHPGAASPASASADGLLLAGIAWCALLGFGTASCVATGDLGVANLGAFLAMGTAGAQCGRLAGAPRMAAAQILSIAVPQMLVCWIAPDHYMRWITVLTPVYIAGLVSVNRTLHREIVEMVSGRQENRRLALRCPLTGLANRRMFDTTLARFVQGTGARGDVFVLCLDLDGFKTVNDRLGHMMGDLLLKEVGARIVRQVPEDALAARLGGDEFAIVTASGTTESVAAMASAIVAKLRERIDLGGEPVHVGVSIGIARRMAGQDAGELFNEADRALYAAKRAGKNTYRWAEPATLAGTTERLRRSTDDQLRDLRPVMAAPRPACHQPPDKAAVTGL